MSSERPVEVAVVGGGCAGIATAFELSRPEHGGRYHVTVYQQGWRLGGKGASGRGPAGRIEEHGLHLWMGYYENAFGLLRECYGELDRDPARYRIADWRDAFFHSTFVALADDVPSGLWKVWAACFPTNDELPGDPAAERQRFTLSDYMVRIVHVVRVLLVSARTDTAPRPAEAEPRRTPPPRPRLKEELERMVRYGQLASLGAVVEALRVLEGSVKLLPLPAEGLVLRLIDLVGLSARSLLETLLENDEELRRLWSIVDLGLAILRGVITSGIVNDPRGFDAIEDFDCREWLQHNGASRQTVDSTFIRSFYDLCFAYREADHQQPLMAAGQGMRGLLRLFFSYRGALFWKMRAGMGDVVFAPFYEVLKRRGVSFRFFHRLENVAMVPPERLAAGESPYVEALEFDVQAEIAAGGEYRPLVDVRGLPCWPSDPDWGQLEDGERLCREGWELESFWDRRCTGQRTLKVVEDFDAVVLAVGLGAVPHVCREIVERDPRWRLMVERIGTVATQALQLWMDVGMEDLGWHYPPPNLTGFVDPFDTWADMGHLLEEEDWPAPGPRSIAYFCNVLPTPEGIPDRSSEDYPAAKREEVRRSAVRFLNDDLPNLWPRAARRRREFRWEVLVDAAGSAASDESGEDRLATQFWTANVNPTDRYVLALPGTSRFRISPLDNTYDNLTIAGDWTDCGYNFGCVEAAMMSGRLAAHAITGRPALEDIVGYDHP